MPVNTGIVVKSQYSFETVCRPLAGFLRYCYLIIDSQLGWPFDRSWRDLPESEKVLEAQYFDVPECRYSASSCWRPRTFPKLAPHVILDEWTSFYAIEATDEEDARVRAGRIALNDVGDLSAEFFETLDNLVALFMFSPDGWSWWEFYSSRPYLYQAIRAAFPAWIERSTKTAGQPPTK
jgi:hypothetical protein